MQKTAYELGQESVFIALGLVKEAQDGWAPGDRTALVADDTVQEPFAYNTYDEMKAGRDAHRASTMSRMQQELKDSPYNLAAPEHAGAYMQQAGQEYDQLFDQYLDARKNQSPEEKAFYARLKAESGMR